jgi:YfiR/HmsC-like
MAYRSVDPTPAGTRRKALAWLLTVALLLSIGKHSAAEEAPVPVSRQAELLARVAAYDRNLAVRGDGKVKILIVTNDNDADSRGVGAAMESAMKRFGTIGGLPSEVASIAFPGGPALASRCVADRVSIVYVTPGLDAVLPELVHALDGIDILTVSAIPRFVSRGVVFGFDLVSGKPTLIINLAQARRQNVAIDPNAVRLMQVIK